MATTIETLQERKEQLAVEIRSLADIQQADWTPENQTRWDEANTQHDEVKDQLDQALAAESRAARRIELSHAGEQPGQRTTDDTLSHRAEDRGRVLFRDVESGQLLEARSHNETLIDKVPDGDMAAAEWFRSEPYALGHYLRAVATGDFDRVPAEVRQQGGGTNAAGGYFLTTFIGREILDLARAQSVMMKAGAISIPMQARDHRIVQVVTDPTMGWKDENASQNATEAVFGEILLQAQTCQAVIPTSLELLQDSEDAARALQTIAINAMASEIDRVGLMGSGVAPEPEGLLNDAAVPVANAAVGAIADWTPITAGIRSVLDNNYGDDLSFLSRIVSPGVGEAFDNLADSTGQPMQPTRWVGQTQEYVTSNMANTDFVVGDFRQALYGFRLQPVVQYSDQAAFLDSGGSMAAAWSNYQGVLRIVTRLDCARLRPTWFAKLEGITGIT